METMFACSALLLPPVRSGHKHSALHGERAVAGQGSLGQQQADQDRSRDSQGGSAQDRRLPRHLPGGPRPCAHSAHRLRCLCALCAGKPLQVRHWLPKCDCGIGQASHHLPLRGKRSKACTAMCALQGSFATQAGESGLGVRAQESASVAASPQACLHNPSLHGMQQELIFLATLAWGIKCSPLTLCQGSRLFRWWMVQTGRVALRRA